MPNRYAEMREDMLSVISCVHENKELIINGDFIYVTDYVIGMVIVLSHFLSKQPLFIRVNGVVVFSSVDFGFPYINLEI